MWSWRPSLLDPTPVPVRTRVALADAADRLARQPEGQRERLCRGALHDFLRIDEGSIDYRVPAWAREAFAKRISGVIAQEGRFTAAFLAPAPQGAGLVLRITRHHPPLDEADLHLLQLFALQMLPALAGGRFLLLTHLPARAAEMLSLLGSGVEDSDICRFLDISRHTMHTHLRHLYRHLGVQSRAELLHVRAVRDGFSLPVTRPHSTGLRVLTPRQWQIAERLVAGSSEKEAAASLGISPHTVHDSLKRIHRRLGVHSRAELIAAVESAER